MGRPIKNPDSYYLRKKREKEQNNKSFADDGKTKSNIDSVISNIDKVISNSDNTEEKKIIDNQIKFEFEQTEPEAEAKAGEEIENEEEKNKELEEKKKQAHPYLVALDFGNNIIAKILKKDIFFTKEEKEILNQKFWIAYPQIKGMSPKMDLFVTIAMIYIPKLGLI